MGRKRLGDYRRNSPELELLDKINSFIQVGTAHCETEHRRVEDNASFERGDQWSQGDAEKQRVKEKPALRLNSIHKLLNAVANREIMDRYKPKAFGRGREDWGIAEFLDSVANWQRDMSETEHEETMAFRKMCASGYGVMHKWWDPTALDGDGALVDEEVPIWNMLWDPSARRQNLVDRRWHMCGKYIHQDDLEALFGDDKDSQARLKRLQRQFDRDSEPYGGNASRGLLNTGTWSQLQGGRWLSMTGDEVFVIEAEWKERTMFYRLAVPVQMEQFGGVISGEEGAVVVDPGSGQQIDAMMFAQMAEEEKAALAQALMAETVSMKFDNQEEFTTLEEQYEMIFGLPFEDSMKSYRETVKFAIITDGTVLEMGERPEGFTYEFMTGFPYETTSDIQFYGMVDVAKAPQDFKNVFYSNLLSLYMTSPKQHLVIEEGALKNVQDFLDEYSKVSGVSIVPDGFVAGGRFLQMDPPRFPPMLESLVNIVDGSVQDIFGLSSIETNTQGDLRRITSGVVDSAKAASNTLLALLFDGLRRYKKRWGLLTIKSLMSYYEPSELAEIVGEDSEYIGSELKGVIAPLSSWPKEVRLDIKIDESPSSISEQMNTVDFLTRTGTLEKWVAAGELPFEEALDLLVTIPKSTREKIKQARAEKQQVQAQIVDLQSEVQKLMALQESFIQFIQSREGGAQILADFGLLQTMAEQEAEKRAQQIMDAERAKAQAQNGGQG